MNTLKGGLFCRRWYKTTQILTRTPLIKFPARRLPDGQALVTLSMDKFGGNQEQTLATKQSSSVDLPASYGRALPISEEEIAAINLGGAR